MKNKKPINLNFLKGIKKSPIIPIIFLAIIVDLIVESLSRHSLLKAFGFVYAHPATFICNVLIVMFTLSFALLTRRRIFLLAVVSAIWILFGTINCILLTYRTTPLSVVDVKLIKDAMNMSKVYFKPDKMIKYLSIIFGFITVSVVIWLKAPKVKSKIQYLRVSMTIVALAVCTFLIMDLGVQAKAISSDCVNIAAAYENNGFVYCFSNSIIDTGISKPSGYSKETIEEIADKIGIDLNTSEDVTANSSNIINTSSTSTGNAVSGNAVTGNASVSADATKTVNETEGVKSDVATEKTPNIIMVQLESFFDVNYLKNITYSENPVENFDALKEAYTSGYLTVPVAGAGTANTEFEIISGMNLNYFGQGEYPYKTILLKEAAESIAYDLKNVGYSTHSMHNNKGTFYGRHIVFPNLGFDTFTSLEYMMNPEKNPIGWTKDNILTDEIVTTLKSTENEDFVYSITVQSHGEYTNELSQEGQTIQVSGVEEENINKYSYYINQINEVDDFVGNLVSTLESYDEDTIVVFYGDHQPTLGYDKDDITNENLFQTEYVIWSNFDLPENDKDVTSYQLTSYTQEQVGLSEGTLTKYHQTFSDEEDYQDGLEMLEYDMLYGEKYIYNEETKYTTNEMSMGVRDIEITNMKELDTGELMVYGTYFTQYSVVMINGEAQETTYVCDDTLKVKIPEWSEKGGQNSITVAQVSKGGDVLSETDSVSYSNGQKAQQ